MFAKLFIALVLLFAGFPTEAFSSGDEQPIRVEPERLDFGRVEQGEPVVIAFTLHNTGPVAQTLQFIDFSEPGLLAQVNPSIEAGGESTGQVSWDTSNLDGEVSGEITLVFDLDKWTKIVLPITGTVVPSVLPDGD